jgi:hypothetical protein
VSLPSFLCVAVLACALAVACADRNAVLAPQIENARPDVVANVKYVPRNWLDPPAIDVEVRPGVTKAQAVAFACESLVPLALRSGDRDLELEVWSSEGEAYWPDVDSLSPTGCP